MRKSKPNRRKLVIGKLTYTYDIGKRYVQLWSPDGTKEVMDIHKFPGTEFYGGCSCGSWGCDYDPTISFGIKPSDIRKYIESKLNEQDSKKQKRPSKKTKQRCIRSRSFQATI